MTFNCFSFQCRAAIAVIYVFAMLSKAYSGPLDSRDLFLSELDRLIPNHLEGIVITYEAGGRTAGITTAGYHAESGAWFVARQNNCAGRDPSGRYFRASIDDTQLSSMQPFFAELISIAEEIPWCYLIAMRSHPQMVVDAELTDQGVWRVLFHPIDPANIEEGRAPWLLRVENESGHVLSSRWTVSDDSPVVQFDWSGTTVGLRVRSRTSAAMFRTFIDDKADLSEFEPERVFQRMKENLLRVDQKLNAVRSGYVQNDEGEWVPGAQPQSTQPFNDPLTRTYRTPLIVGGVLVFLIAIAQLIRKGRTQ